MGTAHTAELKWPNDVLVDGFKICGILAEVLPGDDDTVVIGSGVNTRMQRVDLPVDTASSFAALGLECDDDRLLADYLTALDEQLTALAEALGNAASAGVVGEIEALCGTLGRDVVVSLPTDRSSRVAPSGSMQRAAWSWSTPSVSRPRSRRATSCTCADETHRHAPR